MLNFSVLLYNQRTLVGVLFRDCTFLHEQENSEGKKSGHQCSAAWRRGGSFQVLTWPSQLVPSAHAFKVAAEPPGGHSNSRRELLDEATPFYYESNL